MTKKGELRGKETRKRKGRRKKRASVKKREGNAVEEMIDATERKRKQATKGRWPGTWKLEWKTKRTEERRRKITEGRRKRSGGRGGRSVDELPHSALKFVGGQ